MTAVNGVGARRPAARPAPLRALALFEAAKGVLVLVAGAGMLRWQHGLQEAAAAAVAHLHLNPAKHHALIFTLLTDGSIHARWLALGAAVYATARLVEATGLWLARPWAVWVAVVTATIYVPFEVVGLLRHPTGLAVGALLVNLAVVGYLLSHRGWSGPHDPATAPAR
jgi:uncharacterized membrane protein (DUF2068 family)